MKALAFFGGAVAADVAARAAEHLSLAVFALAIATAIGVPLGLALTRRPSLSALVLGVVNVVQTVPSLALLGMLIPLTGIGRLPAIAALFLYALMPIVRNTVVGVAQVEPSVREAAVGMGMTDLQVLSRVELPLAVPVIFAGVRTAAVVSVGVATLAALVGAGGLGVFIFRGISLADTRLILEGAVPAAALALFIDGALAVVEKRLSRFIAPAAVVLAILAAGALLRPLFASRATALRIAMPGEFIARKDGYSGLASKYDLHADVVEMDHGLMYSALHDERVDAVVGYTTDGEIARYGLRVLSDDRHYFPPYWAAPVVRVATLSKHPELGRALDKLSGRVDDATMAALNARVEHDHEEPAAVARRFLLSIGLEPGAPRRRDPADVVIGSKIFAEQYVLAEMFAQLVESETELSVKLATGLGGTKICFDALRRGDIDVYPEYTGTALFAILAAKDTDALVADPKALFEHVKQRFQTEYALTWLEPLGFDNSYAVVVRRAFAERWHVGDVSTLARLRAP